MRFNTTYTQKSSLKETIENVADIRELIIRMINKEFSLTKVSVPLFLPEDSELLINLESKTRAVTFDESNEYKVNKLLLSNTNWLRELLARIDVEDHKGIYAETQVILRDVAQKTSNTLAKDEIVFQVRLKKGDDHEKFSKDFVYELYDFFYKLIEMHLVEKETNIYPKDVSFYSSQNLELEYPDIDSKEKEFNKVKEMGSYILSEPGRKKYSNKIHKSIHPAIYDLKNYFEFLFKDDVNSDVIKVASVAILASGQVLEDQIKYYNVGPLMERKFYSNLAKQEHKVMEVKINVPKLAMIVLSKAHISEVQGGVYTKESKTIATKHKIEII